jgi:hypothetical protein
MAYRSEVILRSSFMAVILYIFLRLWTVVYADSAKDQATNRIAGLSLRKSNLRDSFEMEPGRHEIRVRVA